MSNKIVEFVNRMNGAESEDDYISLLLDLWVEPTSRKENYVKLTPAIGFQETVQTEEGSSVRSTKEDREDDESQTGTIDDCRRKEEVIDSLLLECFNELRARGYTNYDIIDTVCSHPKVIDRYVRE